MKNELENVKAKESKTSLKITETQIIPITTNTNPILNADIFISLSGKLFD